MGTLWRSETMEYIELIVQLEGAHDMVDELGKVGMVEFRDMNPDQNAFQRNFTPEVKRADEMSRRLRFFEAQIEREGFTEEDIEEFQFSPPVDDVTTKKMEELDARFEEVERELVTMNGNHENLTRNYNELVEYVHVLRQNATFFQSSEVNNETGPLLPNDGDATAAEDAETGAASVGASLLGNITGVLPISKLRPFERVLWRAVRGNMYLKTAPVLGKIVDPTSGEEIEKVVFVVFYQGTRSRQKLLKICESFSANIYPCPDTPAERAHLLQEAEARLRDLLVVIDHGSGIRRTMLRQLAQEIDVWKSLVTRDKEIYHTMNMFSYDAGHKCMYAEGWCPVVGHDDVAGALEKAQQRSGARVVLKVIPGTSTPPTYFRTNKYTVGFQNLVDAYGIARYQEVNPAVFAIVTFPFLFGVMFGDVGHGFCVTLVALYMIIREKALGAAKLNEMFVMLFNGRYLLLMMGIHAIYCGALYNEVFSIPIDVFGSRWTYPEVCKDNPDPISDPACQYMIPTNASTAYPFGVDPAWKGANNELIFYNSYKMKLSVILGLAHMILGIMLSLFNGIHFRKPLDIFFEFLPGLVFMLSLIGFMNFLIFYKWCVNWTGKTNDAPLLITVMIEMFLHPWGILDNGTNNTDLFNDKYNIQLWVQNVLVVTSLVCIPLMLFPKPILTHFMSKRQDFEEINKGQDDSSGDSDSDVTSHAAGHGEHSEHEEEGFSDLFVHQTIHTIEFVLGAVGNTASYLRLWALSLAHSELSTVFYNRVLVLTMSITIPGSFIAMFIGFAVWAALTIAILLMMESLSAFLHALRLHWVEMMNKHYRGDGHQFKPLSFEALARGEDE